MDGRGCFGPLEAQEVRRGPNDPRRIRRGSDLLSLQKLGARARHPGTTARSARVQKHPWRPCATARSGWTPATCGAPEEAEGEGGRERGMEGGEG